MQNNKIIFALLGKKESGKSTAAKFIKEKFDAQICSFAKPLKDMTGDIFGLSDDQMYGSLKEVRDSRWNFTPRWVLQQIGNKAREYIDKNIWIDKLFKTVEESSNNIFVIDDCRYINEVEYICNTNFETYVIKLEKKDNKKWWSIFSKKDLHQSEIEVDQAPKHLLSCVIQNEYDEKFLKDIEEFVSSKVNK